MLGTTYKKENMRELEYRIKKYDPVLNTTILEADHSFIHSDNWLKYSPAPTVIMQHETYEYEFDEMELTGSAYLWIYHPGDGAMKVKTTVHKFIGDKTGQLHLRINQKLFVEVVESITNKTEAPCSYIIDAGSEIVFPSEVHVHGTNSTFAGQMTGLLLLYIEDKADVEYLSTANTALVHNEVYFRKTDPGTLEFDEFHVKRGGVAGFLKIVDEPITLITSEFKVKYQGNLYMNDAHIVSTYAWIEERGCFST